jgi:hypothetical protein
MFPRTSNGQKPVDMFLANLKTVDMFLEPKVRTGRIVDMFLTAILRTGTKNDYLFRFLVPPGTRKHIAPHMPAFKTMNPFEFSLYNHTLGEGSKGFIVLLYQICERDRPALHQVNQPTYDKKRDPAIAATTNADRHNSGVKHKLRIPAKLYS